MMAANIVNVLALILVLRLNNELPLILLIWAAVVLLLASFAIWQQLRRKHKKVPLRAAKRVKKRLILNAAIFGVIWVVPGLTILPNGSSINQAFVIALVSGMISGGAMTLYPIPMAAVLFSGTVIAGNLFGFALSGDPSFWSFALVGIVFVYVIFRSVERHEEIFVSEFRMRRQLAEKNQLIETLLDQTRIEASEQKQETEAKLARAQKLEAVGTITSGISHDFNNILAVIMGNIELAQLEKKDSTREEYLATALTASKRGAELTHRLLAFSRKAPLLPSVVDIKSVVAEMQAMLVRTLPDNIIVKLATKLEPCFAKIDQSQLESAILNLAINARDAMPEGGQLSVSVRAVSSSLHQAETSLPEGSFVEVSVTDTGTGMSAEVVEKVFEPFFTTKAAGKGSGLGLAMIDGFAKQSGGGAEIHSTPDVGTTVTMFFPLVAPGLAGKKAPSIPDHSDQRFSGTALVVEDDENVRTVVKRQLAQLGFTVDEAANGDLANEILKSGRHFDLIVTDLSMPGYVQGSTLARLVLTEFPRSQIIVMSGFPADAYDELNLLTKDVPCLAKPVQLKDFERAIELTLEKS